MEIIFESNIRHTLSLYIMNIIISIYIHKYIIITFERLIYASLLC